jgi:hypothetical protein
MAQIFAELGLGLAFTLVRQVYSESLQAHVSVRSSRLTISDCVGAHGPGVAQKERWTDHQRQDHGRHSEPYTRREAEPQEDEICLRKIEFRRVYT